MTSPRLGEDISQRDLQRYARKERPHMCMSCSGRARVRPPVLSSKSATRSSRDLPSASSWSASDTSEASPTAASWTAASWTLSRGRDLGVPERNDVGTLHRSREFGERVGLRSRLNVWAREDDRERERERESSETRARSQVAFEETRIDRCHIVDAGNELLEILSGFTNEKTPRSMLRVGRWVRDRSAASTCALSDAESSPCTIPVSSSIGRLRA